MVKEDWVAGFLTHHTDLYHHTTLKPEDSLAAHNPGESFLPLFKLQLNQWLI